MGVTGNLRVIDATVVTPSGNLPARSLPMTFFDVKWLRPPPVQRLFLYRLDHQHHHGTVQKLISDLRHSLSAALTLFYPLAGHVRLGPGTNRYELFYHPGDGVAFTTAEYDVHVDDLATSSDDEPVQVAKLAPLVPPLPKGRAVLAVQATVLLGGSGLALGVTVHHSACDGNGSTHFLHTWAAACAGADMPSPPLIDRTLIADPEDLYGIYSKGMVPTDGAEIEFAGSSASSYPGDQLLATFTLSQELLRGIKDALAAEAARHGGATVPPRCSSLLAAYSFIWSCYCRAKQGQSPMDDSDQTKTTYFLFSVDHRTRLDPPVPKRYLGNCLGPAIAAARHDELAADALGGLFAAFTALADALDEAVGEGARERWDGCVERVKEVVKAGVLSVAGSPRFGVYDVDFGFGRPAKVDVVSVAKTGAMSMAEGRGGRGGVEVGISLPPPGMERFRRCFADAMRVVGVKEGAY
uniref:Uncharacterized protein n=1 Tax=Avena sativa TaxID=4498 RepID=A0ACD5WKT4_AVESA